jgi:hypothetical protein
MERQVLDLRNQNQRLGITPLQQSSQAIADIFKTLGQAEQQRQQREQLDRITDVISQGGKIQDVLAAINKPTQRDSGFRGILQGIGGAFGGNTDTGMRESLLNAALSESMRQPRTTDWQVVTDPATKELFRVNRATGQAERVSLNGTGGQSGSVAEPLMTPSSQSGSSTSAPSGTSLLDSLPRPSLMALAANSGVGDFMQPNIPLPGDNPSTGQPAQAQTPQKRAGGMGLKDKADYARAITQGTEKQGRPELSPGTPEFDAYIESLPAETRKMDIDTARKLFTTLKAQNPNLSMEELKALAESESRRLGWIID